MAVDDHILKEVCQIRDDNIDTIAKGTPVPTNITITEIVRSSRPTISIDTKSESFKFLKRNDDPTKPRPPKDKGKAAIFTLIAVLLVDSTTYGVILSFGIYQEYYTGHFADHSKASWIGVLSNALVFLGAPLVTWCCQHYALSRKVYILIGFILCVISLLVSAFITTLPGLIVTQGLLYGIGALLCSIPALIILNTWFDKHRGLAYGIVFGGDDLLGVVYTYLATELLRKYSLRTTLLVFAAIIFCCSGPAIVFLHERPEETAEPASAVPGPPERRRSSLLTPITRSRTTVGDLPFTPSLEHRATWPARQPKKRYYQRGIFYIFMFSNLLQACAAYLPFIYLPVFATQSGHSKETGALILAIGNIGMLVGDLGFGKLSDMVHVNLLIFLSSGVSAIATFVLWGLFGTGARSQGVLIGFAFLFGCFAGGFIVLWARMGTLFGERDAATIYSYMCLGRGVGGLVSGPISQALLLLGTPRALSAFRAKGYGSLVVFVGICMAGSAITGLVGMGSLWWKKEQSFHPESGGEAENESEKK
ncbi:hypothetical protein LTS08_003566 [Lithohypha guttulata]|nr:hypothetical protein LTS08_003566 [Lithohypha guttulata]